MYDPHLSNNTNSSWYCFSRMMMILAGVVSQISVGNVWCLNYEPDRAGSLGVWHQRERIDAFWWVHLCDELAAVVVLKWSSSMRRHRRTTTATTQQLQHQKCIDMVERRSAETLQTLKEGWTLSLGGICWHNMHARSFRIVRRPWAVIHFVRRPWLYGG
jgi:hypothetical protein